MNIIEILERPSPAQYTEEEMIFAVKEYIKQKKGLDIDVNLLKGVDLNSQFSRVQMSQQYIMLNSAFENVQKFFDKTNYTK